jgi:glucose dehydrogenase
VWAPILLTVAVCLTASTLAAQGTGDWVHPGHDLGGQRFSPRRQITTANVATLQVAWSFDTGALNLGGGIATAGGVIVIGATNDPRFRAFESRTGKLLWEATLEASAHAVPATYLGKDGRQYVVTAAGGGSCLGSPSGSKIVAYALPKAPSK